MILFGGLLGHIVLGALTGLSLVNSLFWILPVQGVYWATFAGLFFGAFAYYAIGLSTLRMIYLPIWGAAVAGFLVMFFVEAMQPESIVLPGLLSDLVGLSVGIYFALRLNRRPRTSS